MYIYIYIYIYIDVIYKYIYIYIVKLITYNALKTYILYINLNINIMFKVYSRPGPGDARRAGGCGARSRASRRPCSRAGPAPNPSAQTPRGPSVSETLPNSSKPETFTQQEALSSMGFGP